MQKVLIPILLLLSFLAIVALPSSLMMCAPYGCSFEKSVCDSDFCIDETLAQHLGERGQLLIAIAKSQLLMFVIILSVVFIIRKFLKDREFIIAKSYIKQKLLNFSGSKLFNYLIEIFSSGILHPKSY